MSWEEENEEEAIEIGFAVRRPDDPNSAGSSDNVEDMPMEPGVPSEILLELGKAIEKIMESRSWDDTGFFLTVAHTSNEGKTLDIKSMFGGRDKRMEPAMLAHIFKQGLEGGAIVLNPRPKDDKGDEWKKN